jgi:hypothetical protein
MRNSRAQSPSSLKADLVDVIATSGEGTHNLPPAHASIGCLLPPSPANLTGTPVAQNATITESHDCGSSRFTALPNFSIVRSPRPYLPHHVGGEDRGETAGLAHPASPAARRRPDKYSSRCSGFLQFMALGTTTFVRLRSRSMASRPRQGGPCVRSRTREIGTSVPNSAFLAATGAGSPWRPQIAGRRSGPHRSP